MADLTQQQKQEWAIKKQERDRLDYLKRIERKFNHINNLREEASKLEEETFLQLMQFKRSIDLEDLKWKKKTINYSDEHWRVGYDTMTDHKETSYRRNVGNSIHETKDLMKLFE